MPVLIAFGSIEGQTGKIAAFVKKIAEDAGETVELFDTSVLKSDVSVEEFDKVILAGSVHERRHPKEFELFVASNQKELENRRTLLISVSLNAAFPERYEEAQDYADELKMRTDIDPDGEILVAGAIRAHSYDYFATQVLRHVVLQGRNYDPSVQEHEFTDWDALEGDIRSFLKGENPGQDRR